MSFLKCLPLPAKLATCTPVCRRHAPDLSCSMRGGNGFPPLTETHFTQKVLPVKFKFNEKAGKLVAYIIYSTPKMPLSFTHGRFFFFLLDYSMLDLHLFNPSEKTSLSSCSPSSQGPNCYSTILDN